MTLNQAMAAVNRTAAIFPFSAIDTPEWNNLFAVCAFFEHLIVPHQPVIKRKYVFKIGRKYKTFYFPAPMTYLDVLAVIVKQNIGKHVTFIL